MAPGLRSFWIPAFAGIVLALPSAAAEVAVDVGHYAAEPGVISASGRPEFEYNRDLALEVKAELEKMGQRVRLIGERGDHAVLHRRARAAAGADLLVSIHHDSVKERLLPRAAQFSGFSIFVSRENSKLARSLACASAVGGEMRAAGLHPSRYHADPVLGENRPFADETNGVHFYDHLAVLRGAAMPAVLVEAGVIANAQEELHMQEAGTRRRIAAAIAAGVRRCLG